MNWQALAIGFMAGWVAALVIGVVAGAAPPTGSPYADATATWYGGGWRDGAFRPDHRLTGNVMANGAVYDPWDPLTAAAPLHVGTTVPFYPLGSWVTVWRTDVAPWARLERAFHVTVQIRDTCPGCAEARSLVDLSLGAFLAIGGEPHRGRVPVRVFPR